MDHTAYLEALRSTAAGTEHSFDAKEFRLRRQRVATAMNEAGLEALLVTNPGEINYLTGYRTFEVSVHAALIFRPERCFLQVPSIETGPAAATALVDEVDGYRWESVQSVIAPLVDQLRDCRWIGVNQWGNGLRPGVLDALRAQLPNTVFHESSAVMDSVRRVKTAAELERLHESARMTMAGLEAAMAVIEPGVSENTIVAEGSRAMLAAGSEFMSLQPIVVSGPRSSVIHLNHQSRVVAPDESVFLEFGAVRHRYTAPQMRTAVAGHASKRMEQLNDVCRRLHDTLVTRMRPGQRFCDAATAANRVLADVADDVFFSGVFGYTVGAQFPPSWVEGTGFIAEGEQTPFEPGMVFHLPLCLRAPGEFGIGMSNTVVVAENGAIPITSNDWQLRESSS
ncbi:Xaa-Pro peptidase family protein [Salicola sp. Rm-C-2C1-2]|uniref:M24 family metallopeptidase n=1 Tax=Salicola sp. Rm-C-2C1-2 TaxID=3141321 RepID=UPI0032E48939